MLESVGVWACVSPSRGVGRRGRGRMRETERRRAERDMSEV